MCIKIPLSLWMQCWSPRRGLPCSLREWHKTFTFFGKSSFYFSSIRSDGNEECSDYNFPEEFLTKGRKFFPQCTKTLKKHINQKIDLHKDPIVSVNAVLTTPPKLSLQSPRMIKNLYFFRKIVFLCFLITFLWTRRMRWLQTRWRIVDKRPKMFHSKYKNGKKTYILKKMICIKIPLSLWMQCWSPRRRFPCSLREWHKTYTFFEKSFFVFPHYVPMDTKNAVITTSLKSCRQKAEIDSLKVQKW